MRKWMIVLSVVVVLAAGGAGAYYYYFVRDSQAEGQAPAALTAKAVKGDLSVNVSGTGSVAANTRETVTAGKKGTIATLSFKEGDTVKKGQVLATFEETGDYDDQIKSIQKEIEKQKLQMEQFQEQYKAATGTENEEDQKKSIEQSMKELELDIADNNESLQDIYEEQAEANVKQVVATIDGEVTASDVEVGDEVESGTTIAEIVNYGELEFVTSVDELDIPSVKVGQTAQITLSAITDRTIEATVSEIAKEGESTNGSSYYSVNLLLKDIDGVMVGMSGQADITIESKKDVVLVPVDAVIELRGKSYVRVPAGTEGASGSAGGAQGAAQGQAGGGTAAQGGSAAGQAGAGTRGSAGGGTAGQGGSGAGQAGAGTRGSAGGAQGAAQGQAGGAGRAAITLGGQLKEVAVGISNETYVEIVSGVSEGDTVLLPTPQGEAGMGSSSTQQQMQFIRGAGGFGGGFQSGGGGGFRVSGGMGGGQ